MNFISGLVKVLYWPICRAYSRYLGDRPADALLRGLCSLQFLKEYHFWPNFVRPHRFSEKVWSRQLHERDPQLTMISDKLRLRDYVANKVGGDYLIPLLWNGENPEEIPFDELPNNFVIKTNHGCGFNIIVKDKMQLDVEKAKRQLNAWLGTNYCNDTFLGIAWGYRNVKPHIIIESFIGENGKVPVDYKLFCFSGQIEYFKIDFDRFEGHSEVFFDKELNRLNLVEKGLILYQGDIDLPAKFDDMIRVAVSLSEGFDFIRVDLFYVNNKIFFSELTPYPGGVSAVFVPDKYDYDFGEKWKHK